ncbi:MAG: hypothetical protein KGL39_46725 [Patescibacteria group bacterium]|nr:hypothetical protein [Patescibacteria group bacterium]
MNYLIKLNGELMNAPAGVVVILFAIAVGYVLKMANFFPNKFIPLVIVCLTAFIFPTVQLCADLAGKVASPWLHLPINALIGVILGFAAWMFHARILKRWVDPRFLTQDENGNTKFTIKQP